MASDAMLTGGCLCGDIAFAIDGPVQMVAHCHCSMCRKSHGSAFATLATVSMDDFRWVDGEERFVTYQSSAHCSRRFCARCGSVVLVDGDGERYVLVPLGNVAGDPGVRPRLHAFTASKAPWHAIVDDLPRHEAHAQGLRKPGATVSDPPACAPKTPGAVGGSCLCGAVAYEFDPPPLRIVQLPLLAMPTGRERRVSNRPARTS